MPEQNQSWRPMEFDGLVIESATGDRLLALPTAILEILRHAAVIRFKRGDAHFNMRLDAFTDGRPGGRPLPQQPTGPAPEPAASPSPAPPPAPEADPLDLANIPLYVKRDGAWTTTYVTRAQYERYTQQGRILPNEGTDQQ